MVSTALVFALLTVALVTCNELESRVYNGEEIGSHEFTFLVELKTTRSNVSYTATSRCSGSILNSRWILTAAHCVSGQWRVTEIKVTRFGNSPVTPPLAIESYNIHPDYVPSEHERTQSLEYVNTDLALLQTTMPIKFNKHVQPITLGREPAYGPGVVAGYGKPLFQPRKGEVLLTYCPFVNKQILCTYRATYMSRTGGGDSGGPVVANGLLVGVVSSESYEYPFIYGRHINYFADIQSNLDWIQSVIPSL